MENAVAIKVNVVSVESYAPVNETFWVELPESGYETKTVEGLFEEETAFKAIINNELSFPEVFEFNCGEEVWLPRSSIVFALNEIEYFGWLQLAEHYGSGSIEEQLKWIEIVQEWIENNPGVTPYL